MVRISRCLYMCCRVATVAQSDGSRALRPWLGRVTTEVRLYMCLPTGLIVYRMCFPGSLISYHTDKAVGYVCRAPQMRLRAPRARGLSSPPPSPVRY